MLSYATLETALKQGLENVKSWNWKGDIGDYVLHIMQCITLHKNIPRN